MLRCAIEAANTVEFPVLINLFPGGTYTVEDAYDADNAFPVIDNVQKSLIKINGHGATIIRDSAAPEIRFFEVSDDQTLFLEDLALEHGAHPDEGGSIYTDYGNLTLLDVSIVNNHFSTGGVSGGAIYIYGGRLYLVRSIIANINSDYGSQGFGIRGGSHVRLVVDESNFHDITSPESHGGAISTAGHFAIISNSRFVSNVTEPDPDGFGGAIKINSAWGIISNSLFDGNAAKFGGAIDAVRDTHIIHNIFRNNVGSPSAYLYYNSNEDNQLYTRGSAIYGTNETVLVGNCFDNNTPFISVYNHSTSGLLSAPNNWWGDPSGPTVIPMGAPAPPITGDTVSTDVDFNPPLTEQPAFCDLDPNNDPDPATVTVYPVWAGNYGLEFLNTIIQVSANDVPAARPILTDVEGNEAAGPMRLPIEEGTTTVRVKPLSIAAIEDISNSAAWDEVHIGIAQSYNSIPQETPSLTEEPSDNDGIYWFSLDQILTVDGLQVLLPEIDVDNNYDVGLTIFLCQDAVTSAGLWDDPNFSLPTCGDTDLTLTYQWGNGSGYTGADLPNSRVVVDVDGLDLQAFLDSTNTANFSLPTDPDSVKTQMIKVAGIDPAVADQVGVAIQDANAGGQTLTGPSFSNEIPAGVTWYALSDADNLNHLVELTFTENGTDFSASVNVWLCHIDTGSGGTASALPTLAIMMVMLGGAMGVMGIVVKKERTRLTYWLLAGLLVSGALLVVSMDTGTVEAFTFDPGTLPDCPAQSQPTATPPPIQGYIQIVCTNGAGFTAKGRQDHDSSAAVEATYPAGTVLAYYNTYTPDPNLSNIDKWYRVGNVPQIWVASDDGGEPTPTIIAVDYNTTTLPTGPAPGSGCTEAMTPTSPPTITPSPNVSLTPTTSPTAGPSPTQTSSPTPTDEPVIANYYVTCDTAILAESPPNSGRYVANARNMASTYGTIIAQFEAGTVVFAFQQVDDWVRITDYNNPYNGYMLWMNLGALVAYTPGSTTVNCGEKTPIPATQTTPYPTLTPSFTYSQAGTPHGEYVHCPLPDATDFQIISWTLACEAGNDPLQAIDIAHVMSNRVEADGFPDSAIGVVTQSFQWDCYYYCSQNPVDEGLADTGYLADALINNTELPPSANHSLDYQIALFTYGNGPYPDDPNPTPNPTQVISDLESIGCTAAEEHYLYHTNLNDSNFITILFSDFHGC